MWETKPLPNVCRTCTEDDCYNCDYAGLRWKLDKVDELNIRKKMLIRAIIRLQKQIEVIDEALKNTKNT